MARSANTGFAHTSEARFITSGCFGTRGSLAYVGFSCQGWLASGYGITGLLGGSLAYMGLLSLQGSLTAYGVACLLRARSGLEAGLLVYERLAPQMAGFYQNEARSRGLRVSSLYGLACDYRVTNITGTRFRDGVLLYLIGSLFEVKGLFYG